MLLYLLIAIDAIVGLLLIGVILLQRSKDQGLGLAFGAGMGESLFGSQAVNVLIKVTVVLACIFFLDTLILARMMRAQAGDARLVPEEEQRRARTAASPKTATETALPAAGAQAGGTEQAAPVQPFVPAPASGTEPAGPVPTPAATGPVSP